MRQFKLLYGGCGVEKKMTITVTGLKPGNIRGQMIAEAKAKGYKVTFDVMTDLYNVEEGKKYVIEFRTAPPRNLSKYVFCGHGYVVTDVVAELKKELDYTIFSVWGIIFKFEPKIKDLEPEKKYYLCIRPA
jgi:DNA-directed RNA polymerase subunit G